MNITREEAIKKVGEEVIKKIESESVEFTNRVTDGTPYNGYTEFSASVDLAHDDWDTLIMYVFVDNKVVENCDQLDEIDWVGAIKSAEFRLL